MGSGHIRDFSKPDPDANKGPRILSTVKGAGVEISQDPIPVEVTVHEEVIREGQDKVRIQHDEDGIEIRIREPRDGESWDKVKRGDDA